MRRKPAVVAHRSATTVGTQFGDSFFAGIAARYGALIWSNALRVTERCDAADEIARDVFAAARRQLDDRRGADVSCAWLVTMTQRRAAAWLDRDRGSTHPRSGDDHSSERLEVWKQCELFEQSLAVLPERSRDALILAHFGARSSREIAFDLDIAEREVQTRLRYGLRALADHIDGCMPNDDAGRGRSRR